MKFNKCILMLAAGTSLIALSSATFAQSSKSEEDKIEFSADQVTYDTDNNTVSAVGRVHLERDGYILDAGEIFYNEETGEITASGAVVLVTPTGDKIYAPRIALEDSLKKAFIEDVRLLMTDGSQVRAKSASRNAESGETALERAVYSPCKICKEEAGGNPLWQIKAVKVVHNKEKRRLYYTDAVLEFFGMPVLWTPKFSHPDPTVDKASGLLPLNIKTTENLGFYLGIPYHWVINDSQDLTVTPIVTTSEGLALDAEYRRHIGSGQFKIGGSITRSNLNIELIEKTPGATPQLVRSNKSIRGHIATAGQFNHTQNWRSTYQINWASDDTYLRRYEISDEDTLISQYNLEGFYGRSYISARTIGFQGLRKEDIAGKTGMALPLIDVEFVPKTKLFGGNINFKGNALALVRTSGQDTKRLSFSANWRKRWITSFGLVLDADALVRSDYYSLNNSELSDDIAFTGTLAGSSGTAWRHLARISTTITLPLVKYGTDSTHTVEPIVEMTVSPNRGAVESIVNEDSRAFELNDLNLFSHDRSSGYDVWEDGSRLTYGLRWQYEGSDLSTDVMFGQTWRLTDDFAVMAIGVGLEEKSSNFVGRTTINYRGWLDFEHRYRLNESTLAFVRNDLSMTIGTENYSLTLGYLNLDRRIIFANREDREEIRTNGFLKISDNWKLHATFIKRLKGAFIGGVNGEQEANGNVEYSVGASYENECVALGVTLRKNYTEDRDIRPGTSILFRLKLTNLG